MSPIHNKRRIRIIGRIRGRLCLQFYNCVSSIKLNKNIFINFKLVINHFHPLTIAIFVKERKGTFLFHPRIARFRLKELEVVNNSNYLNYTIQLMQSDWQTRRCLEIGIKDLNAPTKMQCNGII